MERVYLGLGANLGDPIQQLITARSLLKTRLQSPVVETSSFYRSAPVGFTEQPDFINTVCRISTALQPHDVLAIIHSIEFELGRKRDRHNQNAPRLVDIDILYFGSHVLETPDLVIPHPRALERQFVLAPLLEIILPSETFYDGCLQAHQYTQDQEVVRLTC